MIEAFKPNTSPTMKVWAAILAAQGALFLVLWNSGGRYAIPGPLETFQKLGYLVREEGLLYELIFVSLSVNVMAILISTVLSISLSYLTVLPVARPLVEFCSKARFFSLTGWVTVFTFAFGGGYWLKVSLLTFGMSVFFITSMASVVSHIPKAEWDQARTLRMGPWRSVWEVVVLGKVDSAFEVLRQNAAMGWMMLTMVEGLVRSEGGIGTMLLNTLKYRQFDVVFAIQVVLFLVGFAQDQLLAYLKYLACPYAHLTLERK